ncbi:hypothetical protein C1Y40_00956 [Mycobacterium talmoniae]|nr:hypothetical protein C1Y40_00956 [Mycobacterium talmoniae]
MPTLEVSQPVVAAVLGVVVLGETLNTDHAAMAALAVAALVMALATVELARGDAVATHSRVRALLHRSAAQHEGAEPSTPAMANNGQPHR